MTYWLLRRETECKYQARDGMEKVGPKNRRA
jgi:hypothetical protein